MTNQPDYSKAKSTAEMVAGLYAEIAAGERHEGADVSGVTIERSDAIDAAGALLMMARDYRRQARSRRNGGERNARHRAWLRGAADVYDAAAKRVQRAADDAGNADVCPRSADGAHYADGSDAHCVYCNAAIK
jgi:hypothetical protein